MLYLKELQLINFKSFKNAKIKFTKGINGIVGPNGSGKSNIFDAILFVFGIGNQKKLRVSKYREVINIHSKDGVAKVIAIISDGKKEYKLERKVTKEGKIYYKIDGKRCTHGEVLSFLNEKGIPVGGNNVLSQGEVTKFLEITPKERADIILDAIGVSVFDEKKKEAEKKLEFVKEKLKEGKAIKEEREKVFLRLKEEAEKLRKYKELKKQRDILFVTFQTRKKEMLEREIKSLEKELEREENTILKLEREKEKVEKDEMERKRIIKEERKELFKMLEKIRVVEREKIRKSIEMKNSFEQIKELAKEYRKNHEKLKSFKDYKERKIKKELKELEEKRKKIEEKIKEIWKKKTELERKKALLEKEKEEKSRREREKEALINIRKEIEKLVREKEGILPIVEKLEKEKRRIESNLEIEEKELYEREMALKRIEEEIEIKKLFPGKKVFKKIKDSEKKKKLMFLGFLDAVKIDKKDLDALYNLAKEKRINIKGIFDEKLVDELLEKIPPVEENKDFLVLGPFVIIKGEKTEYELNEEKEILVNEIEKFKKKIEEEKGALDTIVKKLEELKEKYNIIIGKLVALEREKEKIEKRVGKRSKYENLENIKKEIGLLEKEIEKENSFVSEKKEIERRIKDVEKELEEIRYLTREKERVEKELEKIRGKISELGKKYNKWKSKKLEESNLNILKEGAEEKKKRLDEIEKEIREIEKKRREIEKKLFNALDSKRRLLVEIDKRREKIKDIIVEIKGKESFAIDREVSLSEIEEVEKEIRRLGYINFRAEEEYEKIKKRYEEIRTRVEKIEEEYEKIMEFIGKIEEEKERKIKNYIENIGKSFNKIVSFFFEEGVSLEVERKGEEYYLNIKVEKGNKEIKMDLLSGGERSILSFSFLFSLIETTKTPIVLLDEVDSFLDGENSERFGMMLKEISKNSQVLIISHNSISLKNANKIIGITKTTKGNTVINLNIKEIKKMLRK